MLSKYISFASWEDRFAESLQYDIINNSDIKDVFIFYSEEFKERTRDNIEKVKKFIESHGLSIEILGVSFNDNIKTWKLMKNFLDSKPDLNNVIVNISTMPRNMIYSILHFLNKKSIYFKTHYYYAKEHSVDLTKNPSQPQMILQHSGITDSEKKTILVALLGYDTKRVYQLYNYFEPAKIYIGIEKINISKIDKSLDEEQKFNDILNKELFEVISYEKDNIIKILEEKITPLLNDYNVLLCSLGPKLSAVELYKYNLSHPETALVYAPSKDYSHNYSTGFDSEKFYLTEFNKKI